MKICISLLLNLFTLAFAIGRQTDTLTFYSQALNQNRTIYVQTPEFYAYQSDSVQLPVVYILDGQHEWFVNPITTTLRYLQYTHEIPQYLGSLSYGKEPYILNHMHSIKITETDE